MLLPHAVVTTKAPSSSPGWGTGPQGGGVGNGLLLSGDHRLQTQRGRLGPRPRILPRTAPP